MSGLKILANFFSDPVRTGAIAPSSKALARLMVESAAVSTAEVVVEIGAGTGVFTAEIVRHLRPDATFLSLEIDQELARIAQLAAPTANVVCGDAADVSRYLQEMGVVDCDCIVSGLPWAGFPEELQDRVLGALVDSLRPGGRFVTFAYLQGLPLPAGRRFTNKMKERFEGVTRTGIIWRNLPPALVICADKAL